MARKRRMRKVGLGEWEVKPTEAPAAAAPAKKKEPAKKEAPKKAKFNIFNSKKDKTEKE